MPDKDDIAPQASEEWGASRSQRSALAVGSAANPAARHTPASHRALALDNEILRGVVGSTAHGTGMDGQEDRDEMGICVEPIEYVCGLAHFEQYIFRTQPEGVRSGPGDLDLTIYSLRKFCALAAKGNPSVLVLLWLPAYMTLTETGRRLLDIRDAFVSREAGWRFAGYLTAQRMSLTGERTKKVSRPELVEQFGYDTKFAMHALRLGLQGIEYLTERRISLPVREPDRTRLRAVRHGEVPFGEVLAELRDVEARLRETAERCSEQADLGAINRFLADAHQVNWAARRAEDEGDEPSASPEGAGRADAREAQT